MSITGGKTIIVTGKYDNAISGAGESGTVQFIASVKSLSDPTDGQFLTLPPMTAYLPGTIGGNPNQGGPGTFSLTVLCTDNTELFPESFSYTVLERITNLTRITKNVLVPSTLGSTVDLNVLLAPYLTQNN
jgi:hypothetical protein